jgi:hypothetical protein
MRWPGWLLLACLCVSPALGAEEALLALDREQARQLAEPASHEVPTIVALWSLDCPHCKRNLRLFAALAGQIPDLRVVTVATEPAAVDMKAVLDALGVPGARYAYGAEMPEALAYALDPRWRGELPRTLFFDGRGGRTAVSGVQDEAFVRQALGLAPGGSTE